VLFLAEGPPSNWKGLPHYSPQSFLQTLSASPPSAQADGLMIEARSFLEREFAIERHVRSTRSQAKWRACWWQRAGGNDWLKRRSGVMRPALASARSCCYPCPRSGIGRSGTPRSPPTMHVFVKVAESKFGCILSPLPSTTRPILVN
jgi:hypothetical protein